MRALAALTIGGAVLVIGCATGADVEETPGPGGSSGSQNDASSEEAVVQQDAATEAAPDVIAEASEAASEAGPEAGPDAAPDVPADAPPEAPLEAAPDVAPEAADPCAGKVCNTPPVNVCKDAHELEVFDKNGTCSAGVCIYSSHYAPCQHGCSMGQCNADPCIGVTCASPPSSTCTNASYLKVYDTPGTCTEGNCSYSSHDEYCSFGCANDACNGDPCLGMTCSTPAAAYCVNATTLHKFDATGTCANGICSYGATDVVCTHGCANGVCKDCTTDGECSAGKWCSAGTCTACTVDAHCGTTCTNCLASGQTCQGGTQCACAPGTKLCGGNCVSMSLPQMGCSGADCTACPLPAFATATDCSGAGGTCGFTCDASLHRIAQGSACVCDAANHWVEVSGACECEQGYVNHSGNCVLNCAGTVMGSNCYWYESASMTFDAAEAACVAKGGHLSSISDAAENATVRGLAAANAWFGLRDLQGLKTASQNGDDCTDAKLLDPLGGRYSADSYYAYDDVGPCSKSKNSSDDMFFRLDNTTTWTWVFVASSSWFDPYIGLWTRGGGSGITGCLSSFLECDDDSGSGNSSRIIRTLDPGSYIIVVDATSYQYDGDVFTLNARRFTFTDGTPHIYQNWASEEPNNSSNNEGCAEINSASGAWNDLSCATTRPAVCKKPL